MVIYSLIQINFIKTYQKINLSYSKFLFHKILFCYLFVYFHLIFILNAFRVIFQYHLIIFLVLKHINNDNLSVYFL